MIITQTPLRISFLGGNTDFRDYYQKYGGCVISSAIDKYIYCIITERFDKKIYVNWTKKEIVDSIDQIEHELVREAMRKVGVKEGIEISFLADIPSEGSGLGSSSSVLVGILNALYHYIGQTPTAQQLAEEAIGIEVDILGKPIGIQDQYIAAFGGLRYFEFQKCGQVKSEALEIDKWVIEDLDNQLMLFFTGQVRKSAVILQEVKDKLVDKIKVLHQTKKLVKSGYQLLKAGKVDKFGRLLHRGWQLKKSLAGNITNGEIDLMYQAAMKAGAIGGKIAGAGGGGFLLLYVPGEKRFAVRKALAGFREMPFRLERDGSKVILNIRRY